MQRLDNAIHLTKLSDFQVQQLSNDDCNHKNKRYVETKLNLINAYNAILIFLVSSAQYLKVKENDPSCAELINLYDEKGLSVLNSLLSQKLLLAQQEFLQVANKNESKFLKTEIKLLRDTLPHLILKQHNKLKEIKNVKEKEEKEKEEATIKYSLNKHLNYISEIGLQKISDVNQSLSTLDYRLMESSIGLIYYISKSIIATSIQGVLGLGYSAFDFVRSVTNNIIVNVIPTKKAQLTIKDFNHTSPYPRSIYDILPMINEQSNEAEKTDKKGKLTKNQFIKKYNDLIAMLNEKIFELDNLLALQSSKNLLNETKLKDKILKEQSEENVSNLLFKKEDENHQYFHLTNDKINQANKTEQNSNLERIRIYKSNIVDVKPSSHHSAIVELKKYIQDLIIGDEKRSVQHIKFLEHKSENNLELFNQKKEGIVDLIKPIINQQYGPLFVLSKKELTSLAKTIAILEHIVFELHQDVTFGEEFNQELALQYQCIQQVKLAIQKNMFYRLKNPSEPKALMKRFNDIVDMKMGKKQKDIDINEFDVEAMEDPSSTDITTIFISRNDKMTYRDYFIASLQTFTTDDEMDKIKLKELKSEMKTNFLAFPLINGALEGVKDMFGKDKQGLIKVRDNLVQELREAFNYLTLLSNKPTFIQLLKTSKIEGFNLAHIKIDPYNFKNSLDQLELILDGLKDCKDISTLKHICLFHSSYISGLRKLKLYLLEQIFTNNSNKEQTREAKLIGRYVEVLIRISVNNSNKLEHKKGSFDSFANQLYKLMLKRYDCTHALFSDQESALFKAIIHFLKSLEFTEEKINNYNNAKSLNNHQQFKTDEEINSIKIQALIEFITVLADKVLNKLKIDESATKSFTEFRNELLNLKTTKLKHYILYFNDDSFDIENKINISLNEIDSTQSKISLTERKKEYINEIVSFLKKNIYFFTAPFLDYDKFEIFLKQMRIKANLKEGVLSTLEILSRDLKRAIGSDIASFADAIAGKTILPFGMTEDQEALISENDKINEDKIKINEVRIRNLLLNNPTLCHVLYSARGNTDIIKYKVDENDIKYYREKGLRKRKTYEPKIIKSNDLKNNNTAIRKTDTPMPKTIDFNEENEESGTSNLLKELEKIDCELEEIKNNITPTTNINLNNKKVLLIESYYKPNILEQIDNQVSEDNNKEINTTAVNPDIKDELIDEQKLDITISEYEEVIKSNNKTTLEIDRLTEVIETIQEDISDEMIEHVSPTLIKSDEQIIIIESKPQEPNDKENHKMSNNDNPKIEEVIEDKIVKEVNEKQQTHVEYLKNALKNYIIRTEIDATPDKNNKKFTKIIGFDQREITMDFYKSLRYQFFAPCLRMPNKEANYWLARSLYDKLNTNVAISETFKNIAQQRNDIINGNNKINGNKNLNKRALNCPIRSNELNDILDYAADIIEPETGNNNFRMSHWCRT